MRATITCLGKGFVGRSIDEFKRLSNIALKLEGIKGPSGPYPLHSFHQPDSLQDVKLMSDVDMGGFSKAHLDYIPPVTASSSSSSSSPPEQIPGHVRFHGTISTALPQNRPNVARSGYAAWRTHDRPPTLFGKSLWDIDMYTYLALRVRSDGRAYLVNVQTESVVPTDLHQHRLFSKRPGEWETVLIKWNDFVRTNHGFVVEPQTEMLRQKVRSIGIGLTDRVPGPFELCIERIWATNDMREGEIHTEVVDGHSHSPPLGGQLRNKQGQHVGWSDK
ncbi:CIA30-domain-containing protein [Xylariaceae sp. FL0016]|nr:CIA30-domain-containing protein [Xylariaceae sp. FL0016]